MLRFVQLTGMDGNDLLINLDNVELIQFPTEGKPFLRFRGGLLVP